MMRENTRRSASRETLRQIDARAAAGGTGAASQREEAQEWRRQSPLHSLRACTKDFFCIETQRSYSKAKHKRLRRHSKQTASRSHPDDTPSALVDDDHHARGERVRRPVRREVRLGHAVGDADGAERTGATGRARRSAECADLGNNGRRDRRVERLALFCGKGTVSSAV